MKVNQQLENLSVNLQISCDVIRNHQAFFSEKIMHEGYGRYTRQWRLICGIISGFRLIEVNSSRILCLCFTNK